MRLLAFDNTGCNLHGLGGHVIIVLQVKPDGRHTSRVGLRLPAVVYGSEFPLTALHNHEPAYNSPRIMAEPFRDFRPSEWALPFESATIAKRLTL